MAPEAQRNVEFMHYVARQWSIEPLGCVLPSVEQDAIFRYTPIRLILDLKDFLYTYQREHRSNAVYQSVMTNKYQTDTHYS